MPQFSGCGPLASHTIPAACLSSTGFRQIRPTRPVGGERVPSSASWSLCCQLPKTRLPHMTRGSLQSFNSKGVSLLEDSFISVGHSPATEPTSRKEMGRFRDHTSVPGVLGHCDACKPHGDQASLQLRGWGHPSNVSKPRLWCPPCTQGGRRGAQEGLSRGQVLYHLTLQQGQLFLLPWRRHLLGAGRHLCHPSWYASCCPEKMKKMKARMKCSFLGQLSPVLFQ